MHADVYSIALLGMSLQTIVSLAVGIRLMALARRSRRFPELALSLVTLLMPALGYPSLMLAVGLEQLSLPGVVPVFFVALSAIMAAGLMNCFFTWRVFRADAIWAGVACALATWLLLAPVGALTVHVGLGGIDAGIRNADGWTALPILTGLCGMGWTSVESLRYYLVSRRRLLLGLADAAVSNRFLLWALASGAWACVTALGGVVLVLGVNPLNHGLFTLCVGLTGLVNSVCLTLCFMPPERYLAWLRRDTVGG
jgi:hypothetical protein